MFSYEDAGSQEAMAHLMSLKVDIAQVQYGRKNSKDGHLVFRSEMEDLHGSTEMQEVLCIILSFYPTVPSLYRPREISAWCVCFSTLMRNLQKTHDHETFYLVEIIVGLSFLQIESLLLMRWETGQHLIEDVIIPLIFGLMGKQN